MGIPLLLTKPYLAASIYTPTRGHCPFNFMYGSLRRQPDAVIAGRTVGRAAYIDIVVGHITTAGDDDRAAEVGEDGAVTASDTACRHLHDVGTSAGRRPRDRHVSGLYHCRDNPQGR